MKPRRGESGFALLLVFLMAACVAIMLYVEVPRVAFEAERQHELLLVDRGNQYKRAIQVFVTDRTNNPMHRYPASVEELESFNNHRYLRHRYPDPMTGKDEWRLVHINGGVLTDSVVTQVNGKPGQPGQPRQPGTTGPSPADYISSQGFMDSGSGANAGGGASRALTRRPSESQQPGSLGDPNSIGGSQGMQGDAGGAGGTGAPVPNAPGLPIPGAPGQPGMPGATGGQAQAQQPCNVYIGGCPTTTAPGQQPGQGMPGGQQPGGTLPGAGPGGAGDPTQGGATPGMPGGAQTAAAAMIGNLLTTPRPGGMPTSQPGASLGGGIAGVASKYEAEGIMVIHDRTAINEWEFIFDLTRFRYPPNPLGGGIGTPITPGSGPSTAPTNGSPGFSPTPPPGGMGGPGGAGAPAGPGLPGGRGQ